MPEPDPSDWASGFPLHGTGDGFFRVVHLFQDYSVVGADRIMVPIADLDERDRRHVMQWLERNGRQFYVDQLSRRGILSPGVSPLALPDYLFHSSEDWIRSTPLYEALGYRDFATGGSPNDED